MRVTLLDTSAVIALGSVLALAAVMAWWLRRRNRRSLAGSLAILVAALAAATLTVHFAVGLLLSTGDKLDRFNEHRWVLLSPWGMPARALGFGAALGIVVLSWLGTRELSSPGRRVAILGARLGAVVSALILFLEPALELRDVAREPNHVAVLVDTSASMALRDERGGPTRLERAVAFLRDSASVLAAWSGRHAVDVYSFDSDLNRASADRAADLEANGPASRVRKALEEARNRYDAGELAGIVLMSDGLATGALSSGVMDGSDIDFLRSLETRVHTVWAGRPGLKDIAIHQILADEFAFVRTVVRIEALVRATGYGHRRIPVTLSYEGKPLRRQWVDLEANGKDTKVSFEFTPSKVGKFVLEISTPVADDEAVPQNNRRALVIRVVRDKFRVLQVAGQPSWDVRALRGMLKQNPNVDLISFFILRTQDDIPQAVPSEMSLIPFPTQELFEEQLPSFDLIVLQNFNFQPYGLAPYLDNIRDYVRGGGALVMLGGPLSLSSGGYANTPIAEVLPFTLYSQSAAGTLDQSEFQALLTEAGATHPATSLAYDERANREQWTRLPALEGVNLVRSVVADAVVLATHPKLSTGDGAPAPVIAVREVGDGRVLAVTTDTLWHWGFVAAADGEGSGHAYDDLWENATRWLIQDPELQLLQVSSDRAQYHPDDNAALDFRIRGPDYKPLAKATIRVSLSRGSSPSESTVVLEESTQSDALGLAHLELGALTPGVYRATAEAEIAGRKQVSRDVFLVRETSAELDRSAADPLLLEQIAKATGGQYLGTSEALPTDLPLEPPRVVRIDRATDVELWSGPWLLVFCLGFLGLEWGLRQRSGYR